ncbi:hypothetical protein Pth03_46850 [Planotetraspora thailandica]|uniref:Uncharacterized protein n=1 Tax=Planotetraspora thailandica TaxID=487172 RepID=A0A8J3V7E2_9ACTN|nr:hypothetical protein [Planotetraspora thailandica]GII56296.1 hypothetical protein Pth03_46850 [Planotetraspora thailandica]
MLTTKSRKFTARAFAATLLTASAFFAFTGLNSAPASATTGHSGHSQHGDNGTVKIHGATTSEHNQCDQAKVCTFYVVGWNFDAKQQVSWSIVSLSDNKEVLHGTLTLDQSGHGRTEDLSLPDGRYKLTWSFQGQNGSGKYKVFTVDCPNQPTTPPTTPKPTPSETPTTPAETPTTPAPTPSETPTTPAPTPSETPSTPATPTPTPTASTPGEAPAPTPVASDLAVTG